MISQTIQDHAQIQITSLWSHFSTEGNAAKFSIGSHARLPAELTKDGVGVILFRDEEDETSKRDQMPPLDPNMLEEIVEKARIQPELDELAEKIQRDIEKL